MNQNKIQQQQKKKREAHERTFSAILSALHGCSIKLMTPFSQVNLIPHFNQILFTVHYLSNALDLQMQSISVMLLVYVN